MTPEYASPEQVRGEPVSAASDVYALGLVLYEALTGRKAQVISEYSPGSIVKVVCQEEPTSASLHNPQLAGDLESVILKAIRKEPERRYASAAALALDLQRYLSGHAVAARPDTFRYRSSKFVQRHRGAFTAFLLAAVSVAAGLASAYSLGVFGRQPRVIQAVQLTQSGRVELGDAIVSDGESVYFTERAGGIWNLAQVPVDGGPVVPVPLPPQIPGPEVLDISRDGSTLLVSGGPGLTEDRHLWMVPKAGGTPRQVGDLLARSAAFSRDGAHIFFLCGLTIFEARTDGAGQRKLLDLDHNAAWIRVSPAPGPEVIRFGILGRNDRPSELWELVASTSRLSPVFVNRGNRLAAQYEDRGGDWMAAGSYFAFFSQRDSVASIWLRREGHGLFSGFARYVTYSRDHRWIALTTLPEDTLWRSRADGTERVQITPPFLHVARPAWSPDGVRIAFAGRDRLQRQQIYVVSSKGGAPETITPPRYVESDPSWSPDGKSLVFTRLQTLGPPPTPSLYIMDWQTRESRPVPGSENLEKPAWSRDGRYIVANRAGTEFDLFDFRTGRWTQLAMGIAMSVPFWTEDSQYVYYQNLMEGADQPIYRVRIRDRKIERIMSSRQIPQSNVTAYTLTGLAPDNAPIASILRSNSDIYALDVDLP